MIVRNSLLGYYEGLEKRTLLVNLQRIKDILKDRLLEFSKITINYANWDNTCDFIKTCNQDYITSNFNPKAFSQLELNMALITDTTKKLVFSREIDIGSGTIKQNNYLAEGLLSREGHLFDSAKPDSGLTGFIKIADTILIVSAVNIRNSFYEGPKRGTFLFARFLDKTEIERIIGIIHIPVEIFRFENNLTYSELLKDTLDKEYGMFSKIRNDEIIDGYMIIKDIKGKPAFLLKSPLKREIYQSGLKSINDLIITNIALGIIILVLMLFMIEKMVLSRLMRLSSRVSEIGHKKDFSSRLFLPGKDELTKLVNSINQMLDELEQSQKDLQINEEKFRSVINNIKEVIYQTDNQRRWLFLNPAWETLSGYKPEDCIGKYAGDFIYYEDRKILDDAIYELYSRKNDFVQCELRGLGNENQIIWIEIFAQPVFSESGEVVGTSGVITDINARKQAEESVYNIIESIEQRVKERTAELSKANEDLQKEIAERMMAEERNSEQAALLDITPDAIMVGDYNNRILFWNKGAESIYGLKKEEVLGKRWFDFLSQDEKEELEYPLSIVDKEGQWTGELHHHHKDGRSLIIEARLTLMYDNFKKQKSILIVCSDITEKAKLEIQFMRAQRMESLGTLASGIAHDLNNILAPLLMSIEILRTRLQGEGEQWLNILDNSVKRGAGLIKQILAFGRGAEGKHLPLQFRHIVKEYARIIKETFPKSINIIIEIPNDLWIISGDGTQLQQLLMNLCVNAKDAMPNGGILRISASNFMVDENYARSHVDAKPGPYINLNISDTGVGIDPRIIDKIFEPFFTTKEIGRGTGLGLSTVFAIIKGHGGFINVYSELNKGTSFSVHLPAIITEEFTETEKEREAIPHGHNELLLLVDDEFSIREITGSTLEAYGYKVLKADNGLSAIDLFSKNKENIKAIIMDMVMPDMDGYVAINKIKEINPDIKIIANSGLADQKKRIEDLNVNEFLVKPFSADVLLKTIYKLLT
jgi:PAS domain S-box-containing protein